MQYPLSATLKTLKASGALRNCPTTILIQTDQQSENWKTKCTSFPNKCIHDTAEVTLKITTLSGALVATEENQ